MRSRHERQWSNFPNRQRVFSNPSQRYRARPVLAVPSNPGRLTRLSPVESWRSYAPQLDLRTFSPTRGAFGALTPNWRMDGWGYDQVVPQRPKPPNPFTNLWSLQYAARSVTLECVRRKTRREVLFALKRGNGSAPKRLTPRSEVRCV